MSTAIPEAITTLAEAERQFQLLRTEDEAFFPEWQTQLPELADTERYALDDLRRRYLYQRSQGQLLEGTVTLLMASPLLAIAGFYDPPFRVWAEESVQLTLDDGEEVLQGRLDVLVLLNQFWVVVLESKRAALSVWTALPQTLAYLMASPQAQQPSFGIVTNGDEILFVKLVQPEHRMYGLSRVFSPFSSGEELRNALQISKRIGRTIREGVRWPGDDGGARLITRKAKDNSTRRVPLRQQPGDCRSKTHGSKKVLLPNPNPPEW